MVNPQTDAWAGFTKTLLPVDIGIGMKENTITPAEIEWVEKTMGPGAKVRAASTLAGSTSSDLFLCAVETRASTVEVVLRRYREWENGYDLDVPGYEAWAMRTAATVDVPTPEVLGVDTSLADGLAPMTLFTYLPGGVVLAPSDFDTWLSQMAEAMFAFHQVDAVDAPLDYFPYCDLPTRTPPEWSAHQNTWARAIDIARGPEPSARHHFLHRDLHPCNVLFQHRKLSGVIDWVNACRGMAGVDVAHCRWNLALMYGMPIADRFLRFYQELAGPSWNYHPYFDLMELVEKLDWKPAVYPGWPVFGLTDLTDDLMLERTEAMLLSALARS